MICHVYKQILNNIITSMSLFGVELNHQLNRIITEIRLNLQKHKFIPNLRTLYRSFAQADPQISGLLPPKHFEKALNENGLFLKQVDLQIIEKAFGDGNGKVNWFQFLNSIKIPLNSRRKEFVSNVFDYLSKQEQKLSVQNIVKHFNPSEIEVLKAGKVTPQYLYEQLVSLLHMPNGVLTKDEFVSFYDDLSLNFPHDEPFEKYVSLQWSYQPEKTVMVSQEKVKEVVKALRFKLIQKSKGTNDEFLLTKLFNEFDENKNGYISAFELDLMLKKLELPVGEAVIEPLFKTLDKNQSGFIEYDEFKRFIFFDPFQI